MSSEKTKVGVFLPSWNRPAQLRLLLESIKVNCPHLFDDINIYFDGDHDDYLRGYDKLMKEEILPNVWWYGKQETHARDMYHTLNNEKYKYVLIVTDDSVFYRPITHKIEDLTNLLEDNVCCFSFRNGVNTTVVDYTRPTEIIEYVSAVPLPNDLMVWNWKQHTNHYGFPAALDGSLFNRKYIRQTTWDAVKDDFDYRKWECIVNERIRGTSRVLNAGFATSALVNIPCNQVSGGPYCKNGEMHKYTAKELNDLYLQDQVIDLENMDFSNIHSVQQELPFVFKSL